MDPKTKKPHHPDNDWGDDVSIQMPDEPQPCGMPEPEMSVVLAELKAELKALRDAPPAPPASPAASQVDEAPVKDARKARVMKKGTFADRRELADMFNLPEEVTRGRLRRWETGLFPQDKRLNIMEDESCNENEVRKHYRISAVKSILEKPLASSERPARKKK